MSTPTSWNAFSPSWKNVQVEEGTSTTPNQCELVSGLHGHSSKAPSKGRRSIETHSKCSDSKKSRRSMSWRYGSESADDILTRLEHLHPSKESALQLRLLSRFLGMARCREPGGKGLQYREGP